MLFCTMSMNLLVFAIYSLSMSMSSARSPSCTILVGIVLLGALLVSIATCISLGASLSFSNCLLFSVAVDNTF